MQVCVYDAGTGISSLSDSLQCFYSTKAQPGAPLSVGRFGVGLTACLLNSHAKTGRDMSIVTKTATSKVCTSAHFCFDEASKGPVLRQYEELDLSQLGFQGTRIQLDLPRLPASSLARVVQRVDLFLARLASLPSTSVSTVFTVSIEGITTEGSAPSKKHCSESEEGYSRALKGSMQVLLPDEIWAATSLSACPGDDSLTVCASAVLCTTALGINDEKGEWDGALQIDVWRCFNGSPILRISRDFEACAITAALRSLKWAHFGLKVKKAEAALMDDNVEIPLGWVLQSTSRDLPKKHRRCPKQLVVVIDMRGSSLPYSNLRKTALMETPVLTRLVQTAVTVAMHKLQEIPDLDESLFLSSKEEKRLEIWTSTIPRVATALTKMLRLSPNLHDFFADKLDLPNHVASYAACNDFLQEVLTEAYPRRNVANTDADADEDEDDDGQEQQEGAAADEEQDSELL